MNLEKTHNRICLKTLPRTQCDGIDERDARDAKRYAQIDKLLEWFAELRDKRSEKIPVGSDPEGQTNG